MLHCGAVRDEEAVVGHGHAHGPHHRHHHDHDHGPGASAPLPAAFDTSVPDEALDPGQASRRALLRRAGLLGAGLAAGTVLSGSAAAVPPAAG
ncbi:hypothetical protein G3I30_15520, partial [Actinospica acidiphila]|nr:hypothetical protein [Actinospica acidiphila]